MNSLDVMHRVISTVRKKYPQIESSDKHENPGYLCFIRQMMGQDKLDDTRTWLGYAIRRAEELGAISHKEVLEFMDGKPHDLRSYEAEKLMDKGINKKISSLVLSIDAGELKVLIKGENDESASSYTLSEFQDIIDSLRVAIYLMCVEAPNRPQAKFGA